MSHAMNYAEMAKKQQEVIKEKEKDVLFLKFKDGIVHYSIDKSDDLLEQERLQAEKEMEDSLEVRMSKAVLDIERRRRRYRKEDMQNYGFDSYTKEFYYKCPESSEEEDN